MGQAFAKGKSVDSSEARRIFHNLDTTSNSYLTLKELVNAAPSLVLPHSIPALFFLDKDKDGVYSEEEFVAVLDYVQNEKQKIKREMMMDAEFRELVMQASEAGVVDCSVHGRTNFRRLSHMRNIRSLYRSGESPTFQHGGSFALQDTSNQNQRPPQHSQENHGEDLPDPVSSVSLTSPGSVSDGELEDDVDTEVDELGQGTAKSPNASPKQHDSLLLTEFAACQSQSNAAQTVKMYCSERDIRALLENNDQDATHKEETESELLSPCESAEPDSTIGAIDAAVMEKMSLSNVHVLVDFLKAKGSREKFMHWLWNLANTERNNSLSLDDLKLFLHAISEDGIDVGELVFDNTNRSIPLEQRVLKEFDTSSDSNLAVLNRDDFMVLADLVTREYEFWESRHLDRIGAYELGRVLGHGSSGIVRASVHVDTHERFAVKIIKKGKCSDLSRLDREIQSLDTVSKHRNVVKLHEVLENKDSLFIFMELCGGGSLIDILRLYPEERLPEDVARSYMKQLFEALDYCHTMGVCHRDVRLENMLLSNDGTLKLTDFGHSGIYTPGWDIFQTSLVGSIFNLSPEQIAGNCYSGEKIDVWSAGIALFTVLVGMPPFYDENNAHLLERIVEGVYEVPGFVSDDAFDLLQCMIRVAVDERATFQELLRHPWFEGLCTSPVMDLVTIPVDVAFRECPEVAEMVIATTVHEYDIHFHLGSLHPDVEEDANNTPKLKNSADTPVWTMKCACPAMDMKFSISLYSESSYSRMSQDELSGVDARIGDVRDMPDLALDSYVATPRMSPRRSSRISSGLISPSVSMYGLRLDNGIRLEAPTGSLADMDGYQTPQDADPVGFDFESEDPHPIDRDDPSNSNGISNAKRIQNVVNEYPSKSRSYVFQSPSRLLFRVGSSSRVDSPMIRNFGASRSRSFIKKSSSRNFKEPHLEVKLYEGESALFLKVCRKLKSIVTTKLSAAAERERDFGRKRAMKRIRSEAYFVAPGMSAGTGIQEGTKTVPSPVL